jgi:hypothetical protein
MKSLFRIGMVFCIVFFICEIGSVYGDEPSLFMGGMSIKLGMTKEDVKKQGLEKLGFAGEWNKTKVLGDGDESSRVWYIMDKGIIEKGIPMKVYGTIWFNNDGKVIWVGKDWGKSNSSEVYGFTKEVFGLLASIAQTPQQAVVATNTQYHPDGDTSCMWMYFLDRSVEICIYSTKGVSPSIQIQERIGQLPSQQK